MNKQLYEALEYCLHAVEDGANPEAVLARYPQLVDELRPLLRAAQQARGLGVPEPSAAAMRQGRVRLLQRADALRLARRSHSGPMVRRLAFTLVLTLVFFFFSGTGLVRASSSTLPGDNLYPVKRTWEDVRLLFVFAPGHREALEGEYEQERLDEVSDLLKKGRAVSITFTGLITSQQDGQITVSGVPVVISNQTQFSGTQAVVGASVIVVGQTDVQGHVLALHVQVLPAGTVVPVGEPETDASGSTDGQPPSGTESEDSSGQDISGGKRSVFHLDGTVQGIQGNAWIVDGRTVYVDPSGFNAAVAIGANVELEGYYTSDGRFVVTKMEVKDSGEDKQSTEEQQKTTEEEQKTEEQQRTEDNHEKEDPPEEHPTEEP